MKLKDNWYNFIIRFIYNNRHILFSLTQRDKEKDLISTTNSIINKPKSTIDNVRKK